MANLRDIFKRRQGLNAITGFNGGSLQGEIDTPSGRATMESRPEDEVRAQQIAGRPYPNVFRGGNLPWVEPGEFIDETQRNRPSDYPPSTRPRMVNPRAPEPAQTNEFAAPSIRDRQVAPQAMPDVVPVDDTQQPTPLRNLMTRPRSVTNPFLDRMASDPSRQERPREVNPTDDVTKSADYVRQIQDKPLSLRDKFGLAAQNIATNLGATPLATRRQRDLARAGEGLQRDLAVDKQSILREQGQMIPFQLPDGSWTQVPAKSVGTLASRQQTQGRTATDREARTKGYLDHLDTMKGNDRKKLAAQLYKSGAFNDSPEGLRYASEVLGVPNELKNAFVAGQMRDAIDDDGNLIQVNRQTGAATGVLDKSGAPVGSWNAAQFAKAEKGRNDRAIARNEQSERNATIVAGGQVARMGDPSIHQGNLAEIDKDIAEIDAQIKDLTARANSSDGITRDESATLKGLPREKATLERERRDEREKLGKITSAQSNQSTRTSGGGTGNQSGATNGSFNLGGWKAAHPNASSQEIQAMRAKAKARNLAIVE